MSTNNLSPFFRGDDHTIRVLVTQRDSDDPVDVTGWVVTSTMKLTTEIADDDEFDDDGYRQVLKTSVTAPDNEDSQAGIFYLTFPSSGTRQLIATEYEIDIQSEASNVVRTLYAGRVEVQPDVTWEVSSARRRRRRNQ